MAQHDKGKSSGSETRKRQAVLRIRMTDDEFAEVEALADKAELTPASYARSILLSAPAPRARRRPSVNTQEVARLLGELGKVGSNLNQIAHHLNAGTGGAGSNSTAEAIADVRAMRDACLAALGRKP
ncbi:plasmid mobilization relaxosome protein MobC [uncultured Roseobacter sp.]|uniref:plasmid mobilization protein n=1 Tax=uncultured Roseobacter sp. TaxID=114847 RepID=UPI002628E481|nr:plasmid mobilization relaxosome protein MobC [uncultured Roseobacter sp.]